MDTIPTPSTQLYPPTVTPPSEPLPLSQFIFHFIRNPLLSLPQQVYEDPIVAFETRPGAQITWVTSPDLIEDILINKVDNFAKAEMEQRVLRPAIGSGVLTSSGQLWRWQRRTMAPLFRHADILSYVPIMVQAAEQQLDHWQSTANGTRHPIEENMVDTTFSIISRTMLAGGEPREAAIIKRASAAFFSRISWEIAYAILRVPQWVPHPGTFCIYRATRALRSSVKSTVQRRRAEPTYGNDLLGRLLAARDTETNEPMTEEQLIDNLLTLLEAGHETTAKALTWTLYLLARAPEWQQRIREELHRVVGDARLTSQHVDDLKVTECVIKEAMRLYPPAPVMIRTPVHATTLGDHKIPAGSLVVIPIYCLAPSSQALARSGPV